MLNESSSTPEQTLFFSWLNESSFILDKIENYLI